MKWLRLFQHAERKTQWIEVHLYLCGNCGVVQGTTVTWTPQEREESRCGACKQRGFLYVFAYHPGQRRFVLPV